MSRSPKFVARKTRRDERRIPVAKPMTFEEEPPLHRATISEAVEPLNAAQKRYDLAINTNRVIFATGPAGTGKTWFATMRAAEALEARKIRKIILTRPAVEAGESLGFLPGELEDKYEPYIRPLRDAFEEKFGRARFDHMLKSGLIEARPLAYLRGSTLKNCWVLLDEAQNLTPSQMKMFLTRIGENSKFLITGDPRQTDINGASGLTDGIAVVGAIPGVAVVRFTSEDVVRDDLCGAFVKAYDN